ncbi:hypothetical protein [Prescottella agglutinans]|uniref:Uncharacterized protein n=1 Tax=Prescottella agglutinans TaxID=1644129 RepID=A0ABT6MFZ7_9NOCA|nr:hypothetical protein [Prescottella agglutinans]MDH6282815.1 hypothetical protein [Prescottella agglutinans]
MSLADDLANTPRSEPPRRPESAGECITSPDGLEFKNVVVDQPIADDWTPIFKKFGKNPEHFEIVDDTVSEKISEWQQSKRTESGDRDVITLYAYSYSARFRRISHARIPDSTVREWRSVLQSITDRPTEAPVAAVTLPASYPIFIADPQLGKPGTEEAVENWKNGVRDHCATIRTLVSAGRQPEGVHIGWMGDETEGVCNNYGSQPFAVELNQSQQLELDYDLRVWTLKEIAALGLPMSASSVISNHGEWTRNGSKDPVTSRSDNASTFVARQVQKMFDELEPFGGPKIDWTIGDTGEPGVVVNLSGVDCYMTHGYTEKGRGQASGPKTKAAIDRQILGDTPRLGAVPLWFFAHYHHHYTMEFEGRALFGLPALEALGASDEYMKHQYGVWSQPGMAGLLVGTHTSRGWSDLTVH